MEIAFEDYAEVDNFSIIQDIANGISAIEDFESDITLIDINLSHISNEDGLELAKTLLAVD